MRYTLHTRLSMMVEGSGITLALSIIQDLVQKDLQAQSRVKVIDLVWMVQNPGSVPYSLFINDLIDLYFFFPSDAMVPFIPLFTALLESSPTLSISVHYTRAYAPRPNNKSGNSKNSKGDQQR